MRTGTRDKSHSGRECEDILQCSLKAATSFQPGAPSGGVGCKAGEPISVCGVLGGQCTNIPPSRSAHPQLGTKWWEREPCRAG